MGTDGSTGNFITYLTKHCIMRDADFSQINENTQHINMNNPVRKNQLDKKFVGNSFH